MCIAKNHTPYDEAQQNLKALQIEMMEHVSYTTLRFRETISLICIASLDAHTVGKCTETIMAELKQGHEDQIQRVESLKAEYKDLYGMPYSGTYS